MCLPRARQADTASVLIAASRQTSLLMVVLPSAISDFPDIWRHMKYNDCFGTAGRVNRNEDPKFGFVSLRVHCEVLRKIYKPIVHLKSHYVSPLQYKTQSRQCPITRSCINKDDPVFPNGRLSHAHPTTKLAGVLDLSCTLIKQYCLIPPYLNLLTRF